MRGKCTMIEKRTTQDMVLWVYGLKPDDESLIYLRMECKQKSTLNQK